MEGVFPDARASIVPDSRHERRGSQFNGLGVIRPDERKAFVNAGRLRGGTPRGAVSGQLPSGRTIKTSFFAYLPTRLLLGGNPAVAVAQQHQKKRAAPVDFLQTDLEDAFLTLAFGLGGVRFHTVGAVGACSCLPRKS